MKMKNANNGLVLWECDDWNLTESEVKDVIFPRSMLECPEISREIVFSNNSPEPIHDFQLL
jgi:hypothetical protein